MSVKTWEDRHNAAMVVPKGHEVPLVYLFRALSQYGEHHERLLGSPLGHDHVLGPAWLDMARGFIALLGGERGRLDAGLLDRQIREAALRFGFDEEI